MADLLEAAWATWVMIVVAVAFSAAALGVVIWIYDRFGDRP